MAAERTEKSKYESQHGGNWISAGQLLAERMCERIARRDGKTLPLFFWKKPAWEKHFRLQAKFASALLKDFTFEEIARALRTPEGRKLYSLGAPWLPDEIKRSPAVNEEDDAPPPPPASLPLPPSGNSVPAPFPAGGILGKLRGL